MAPPPLRLRLKLRSGNGANLQSTSTESQSDPTLPTSNAPLNLSKTNYRQLLKRTNPTAYQLHLLEDAERNCQNRKKWSEKRKAQEREASKLRMRKSRQLKREKEAQEAAAAKAKQLPIPKRKTRAAKIKEQQEREKKRQTNREYQRRCRAKLTKAHKDEINAKRRKKRRQEREELLAYQRQMLNARKEDEERRRNTKEMEEIAQIELQQMREDEKEMDEALENIEKDPSLPRSANARRQSLARARKALPRSPEAYADTLEDLQNKASPRKSAILEKRATKKKIPEIVVSGLKTRLAELRNKRSAKDRAVKRELLTVLGISKKYKQQRAACKKFRVSTKNITKKAKIFKYKNPGAVQTNTKHVVERYYELHSVELPDQKGISKKTLQKTRVLEKPIKELFSSFCKEFPEHNIGQSTFFSLRPHHVRRMTDIKFRGCLCEYCENISLKLKALNKACQAQLKPGCKIADLNKAVEITMCSKVGKYNSKNCIKRNCDKCSVEAISTRVQPLNLKEQCSWSCWETTKTNVAMKKGEKLVTKKTRLIKSGTLEQLVQQLKEELEPLSNHIFLKNWQQQQFSWLTTSKLPEGWCAFVMDFAENYTCKTQDEVQAAHWTQEQVTVHPIICYYNCTKPCEKPVMHSVVIISDDLTHDYNAVHAFSSRAIELMKETVQPLTKVIRFSDGCGAQYKSKGPFVDISYAIVDHKIPMQHEFFGSRHGKGPSDGESAVVKRMTSMAEASHQASITNAHDMFKYCEENLTRNGDGQTCPHFKRTVLFVSKKDINRERGRDGKTLAGTRKIHSIKCVKPGLVASRNISCFCSSCREGFGGCDNVDYMDSWKETRIQTTLPCEDQTSQYDITQSNQGIQDAGDGSHEANGNTETLVSPSSRPLDNATRTQAFKVGVYVAVIYDDVWWVGQVTEMDEKCCNINFLLTKGDNKYIWPDKEERDIVPKSGIFTHFPSPPAPVTTRYLGFDDAVYQCVASSIKEYLKEE